MTTGHETAPGDSRETKLDGKGKQETEESNEYISDEEVEDPNILVMLGNKRPAKSKEYKGNVPPPPVEVYHSAQAQVIETVNGKSIICIKFLYKKHLKKSKG